MSLTEFATSVTTLFHVGDNINRMTPDHSMNPGHFIRPETVQVTVETTTGRTHVSLTGRRYDQNTGLPSQDRGFTGYGFNSHTEAAHHAGVPDVVREAIETVVDKHIVKAEL